MTDQSTCIHHFILPSPDGKDCLGVCKYCGFTQAHKNSFESDNWHWGGHHTKASATTTQSK